MDIQKLIGDLVAKLTGNKDLIAKFTSNGCGAGSGSWPLSGPMASAIRRRRASSAGVAAFWYTLEFIS